jgi:hypothetical protein
MSNTGQVDFNVASSSPAYVMSPGNGLGYRSAQDLASFRRSRDEMPLTAGRATLEA